MQIHKTYIHMNGFALGLGLKRRLRATPKVSLQRLGFLSPFGQKTDMILTIIV